MDYIKIFGFSFLIILGLSLGLYFYIKNINKTDQ